MAKQKKQSMQSTAYDFIRRKIVFCEYAPNQLLSEVQLQEELGCSRTPVREAISRLSQEGLLTVFPKQGIVVSGFTFSDISMIFEVRMLVEPYALRTYGERINQEELRRFDNIFRNHTSEILDKEFYQQDDKFHSLLISALPNAYLKDLYAKIQTQNTRLRILSGNTVSQRAHSTVEEHLQIIAACLVPDWESAAQAMQIHLQRSKESSLAAAIS